MEAGKIMLRESNQQLENHLDQFKTSYKQVRKFAENKNINREKVMLKSLENKICALIHMKDIAK